MTTREIANHERSAERPDGRVLAAISNRIVGLYKEYYGRGPTKARTVYHGDIVVCLLEGGFSRVEQTLADRGKGHVVLEQRSEFQSAVQGEFKAAVAELTGRRVMAFMSGSHQRPDMMCEVFVLEPAGDGSRDGQVDPSRVSV